MYDGPASSSLTALHIATQFPALSLCAALALGTLSYYKTGTSEVQPTPLYDGVTGQILTLPDLAAENLDPNVYYSPKGLKRCGNVVEVEGKCVCSEVSTK
jgi:hypothetical protein